MEAEIENKMNEDEGERDQTRGILLTTAAARGGDSTGVANDYIFAALQDLTAPEKTEEGLLGGRMSLENATKQQREALSQWRHLRILPRRTRSAQTAKRNG